MNTPDHPKEKHSLLGIASFIISILAGGLLFTLFIVASFLSRMRVEGAVEYPGQTVVGLLIILSLGTQVIATALGVAALFQPGTFRVFGILGVTCSTLIFLGGIGLLILGVLYGR